VARVLPARVLVIVGTRPEAIKMAPVVRALAAHDTQIETRVALTGQHDELVDDVLRAFRIDAHWDLEIMQEGQSPSEVGRECLGALGEKVLQAWRPDLVLVQGDTTSVFFGALAAYLERVAVGHVEAGLRSGDLSRPFPEEGYRRMVSQIADLHFAPTSRAKENLMREGVPAEKIHITGNTVVDALLCMADEGRKPANEVLARLVEPAAPPFILLTAHRRESFGRPLERIFEAARDLVNAEAGIEILFPVHPSPHVREPAHRILGGVPRIHLVPPLSYPDLVCALSRAALVLTDSGGIQEEAPTFGTPVLVLREVTERPEGIEAGVAQVVGTDPAHILGEASRLLHGQEGFGPAGSSEDRARRRLANPYGDGRAGEQIAAHVAAFLAGRPSA
jgi:UDP-N-acetylglucosamine 2-epimerase (non-hydrolysing)